MLHLPIMTKRHLTERFRHLALGRGFEEEALGVISIMPNWVPDELDGLRSSKSFGCYAIPI